MQRQSSDTAAADESPASAPSEGACAQGCGAWTKRQWEKPVVRRVVWLLIAAAVLLVFFFFVGRIIVDNLQDFLSWLSGIRRGYAFLIIIAVFQICAFPFMQGYFLMELASGFILRDTIWLAFIASIVGGEIGMVTGFMWGYAFRKRTATYFEESPRLKLSMTLIENNVYKLLFLFRLGPIPYSILNPLCGVSTIKFPQYVLASLPGLIIEQVLVTYMGSSFADLSEVANGSSKDATAQTFNTIILVIQIVATVAVLFVIGYFVKKAIRAEEAKLQSASAAAPLTDASNQA